jgi:ankyrin repeat/BTB/POZ domain-containing protein 1
LLKYKIFRLFEQGLYSDVTFVVDERIFPLHRCVLAARSSFFREALQTRWNEKQHINLTKAKVFFDQFF